MKQPNHSIHDKVNQISTNSLTALWSSVDHDSLSCHCPHTFLHFASSQTGYNLRVMSASLLLTASLNPRSLPFYGLKLTARGSIPPSFLEHFFPVDTDNLHRSVPASPHSLSHALVRDHVCTCYCSILDLDKHQDGHLPLGGRLRRQSITIELLKNRQNRVLD